MLPFCDDEEAAPWRLNETNPVVIRMMEEDDSDSEGLGTVGNMSERMASESIFWRLVVSLRLPIREVENWTLGEMRMATAYLDMQGDYKRIWSSYYDIKREQKDMQED